MSDSLWPHGLQHARLPCPLPTPGAYSNSCPFSQWCHPMISSSVVPFSSCLQSFPASESFPVSQFFTSGGQPIGFSFSSLGKDKKLQTSEKKNSSPLPPNLFFPVLMMSEDSGQRWRIDQQGGENEQTVPALYLQGSKSQVKHDQGRRSTLNEMQHWNSNIDWDACFNTR